MQKETVRVDEILEGGIPVPYLLNQYIALYHKLFPKDECIVNPPMSFRRMLKQIRRISGDYYISQRFIFQIENGELKNLFAVPTITIHAKERLKERFQVATHDERLLRVTLVIAEGKVLSKKEKRRFGISKHRDAVENQGCVYLLSQEDYTVITVLCLEV